MANWSKRNTTSFKSSKNRITRTTNSSGKSTYSSSKKVGNTRTTTSTSGGKIKVRTTEHHPTLGTRTTTRTINKTPRYKSRKRSNSGCALILFAPIGFTLLTYLSGAII